MASGQKEGRKGVRIGMHLASLAHELVIATAVRDTPLQKIHDPQHPLVSALRLGVSLLSANLRRLYLYNGALPWQNPGRYGADVYIETTIDSCSRRARLTPVRRTSMSDATPRTRAFCVVMIRHALRPWDLRSSNNSIRAQKKKDTIVGAAHQCLAPSVRLAARMSPL